MSQVCEKCDERGVTRQLNRALRIVNRRLRRTVTELKEHGDELFLALCEVRPEVNESEQAFRELWERGGFQPPIGPQDYEFIVERAVAALREYAESHTSQTPAAVEVSR